MRAGGTRKLNTCSGFHFQSSVLSEGLPSLQEYLAFCISGDPSFITVTLPQLRGSGGATEQFARAQREETLGPCNSRRGKGAWRPQKGRTVGGFINHHPSLLEGGRAVCFQNTSCWVLPWLNGEMRCQAPVPYRGENFHTPF